MIVSLEEKVFQNLKVLHDILLPHNLIEEIPREAFYGLANLQLLYVIFLLNY